MEIVSFQLCCMLYLENDTDLACYIFDVHQPILINFVHNEAILLGTTVCKYHFSPSHFVFDRAVCSTTEKTISGVHVSPGSADTLIRRAYYVSSISVKIIKIG